MIPSLELRWLKPDKGLSLPLIVMANWRSDYGGCYHRPWPYQYEINGRFYDGAKGIIEIVDTAKDKLSISTGSIIAHEFRHHWQWHQGLAAGNTENAYNPDIDYKSTIINYFMKQPKEMDALMFEQKMYPCDVTREWAEWIIKEQEKSNEWNSAR